MGKVESDFEILLRERLIKYLVKRVDFVLKGKHLVGIVMTVTAPLNCIKIRRNKYGWKFRIWLIDAYCFNRLCCYNLT